MGSQGVIEENDLSEPRGEYAPTHAVGIRLSTHVRTHARSYARTHGTGDQFETHIATFMCVYARLCSSIRTTANQGLKMKNTTGKIIWNLVWTTRASIHWKKSICDYNWLVKQLWLEIYNYCCYNINNNNLMIIIIIT